MNAEEFLEERDLVNMGLSISKTHRVDLYLSDIMEQYANAKVLEALERVEDKLSSQGNVFEI